MLVLRKWLPPAIWMALIFVGSTDLLSRARTSGFVEPILRWIFGGGLSSQQVYEGHTLVRKLGHITEYAVLSALVWLALRHPLTHAAPAPDHRRGWLAAAMTLFLVTGYAALDEYHQSFVPSRTSSWHDVAVDAGGALVGLILLATGRLTCGYWRKRREAAISA